MEKISLMADPNTPPEKIQQHEQSIQFTKSLLENDYKLNQNLYEKTNSDNNNNNNNNNNNKLSHCLIIKWKKIIDLKYNIFFLSSIYYYF